MKPLLKRPARTPGSTIGAQLQNAAGKHWGEAASDHMTEYPEYLLLISVAVTAAATPAVVSGDITTLSCLGSDLLGEPSLTYTWSATSAPPGALVTFSQNASNLAKNTVATLDKPGDYHLTCIISNGLSSVSSSVRLVKL
jgi:hypothetical protein